MEEKFIEFANHGLALRGMLHLPGGEGPFPGVLLLHGFTGQRMEPHFIFVKTARRLAASGIAAMRFDFGGSGESEGLFENMSVLTELADAEAALSFLASQEQVDESRLGVLGLSLGGCVAALLLGEKSLSAAVLWSAVADLSLVISLLAPPDAKDSLKKLGKVPFGGHWVGRRFIEDARGAEPLAAISRSRADVLIVHGTEDPTVPPEHARRYEKAAGERKEAETKLVFIKNATHTYDTVEHEEKVIGLSLDWFREKLLQRHA